MDADEDRPSPSKFLAERFMAFNMPDAADDPVRAGCRRAAGPCGPNVDALMLNGVCGVSIKLCAGAPVRAWRAAG
jgi:hypothetical protein